MISANSLSTPSVVVKAVRIVRRTSCRPHGASIWPSKRSSSFALHFDQLLKPLSSAPKTYVRPTIRSPITFNAAADSGTSRGSPVFGFLRSQMPYAVLQSIPSHAGKFFAPIAMERQPSDPVVVAHIGRAVWITGSVPDSSKLDVAQRAVARLRVLLGQGISRVSLGIENNAGEPAFLTGKLVEQNCASACLMCSALSSSFAV